MPRILEMELKDLLGTMELKRAGFLLGRAIHLKNLASFLRPILKPLSLFMAVKVKIMKSEETGDLKMKF
jgi:hypothetical protein